MSDLGKFKNTMNDMINYLNVCVPRDKEVEKIKLLVETAMSANPRETVKTFTASLEPYADQILTGDDQYFLGLDVTSLGADDEGSKLSNKIKGMWTKLTPDQQEKSKRYIKLLLMLGTIVTKNETLRQIINKYRDPENPLTF